MDCKLNIGDQDIEQIIKDFREYALLISPGDFTKRVNKAVKKHGLHAYRGKVIYGPSVLDIGEITDISFLIETRKLFTGDFVLKLSRE